MDREKQIEEMAKVMLEASTNANVEPVLEMEGKKVVLGYNATNVLNNILEQAFIPFLAEAIYNAGYRKTSDIAMEIFEEIENKKRFLQDHTGNIDIVVTLKDITELKKKYTKDKEDECDG